MKTKTLEQKKKKEPETYTIETIKMKYDGPEVNTTIPTTTAQAEKKPTQVVKTAKL